MILYIKGADFSSSNIGQLNTVIVNKQIGDGLEHAIPNYVNKNSAVDWVLTLQENYTIDSCVITMNGEVLTPTISGNQIIISITNVTGPISIVIQTSHTQTSEDVVLIIRDQPNLTPGYVDGSGVVRAETSKSHSYFTYPAIGVKSMTLIGSGRGQTGDLHYVIQKYDDGTPSNPYVKINGVLTEENSYTTTVELINDGGMLYINGWNIQKSENANVEGYVRTIILHYK